MCYLLLFLHRNIAIFTLITRKISLFNFSAINQSPRDTRSLHFRFVFVATHFFLFPISMMNIVLLCSRRAQCARDLHFSNRPSSGSTAFHSRNSTTIQTTTDARTNWLTDRLINRLANAQMFYQLELVQRARDDLSHWKTTDFRLQLSVVYVCVFAYVAWNSLIQQYATYTSIQAACSQSTEIENQHPASRRSAHVSQLSSRRGRSACHSYVASYRLRVAAQKYRDSVAATVTAVASAAVRQLASPLPTTNPRYLLPAHSPPCCCLSFPSVRIRPSFVCLVCRDAAVAFVVVLVFIHRLFFFRFARMFVLHSN